MSSLKTTLTGYARYRGREGHWSFLLHRITGLGTILFLALHIVDIALVYFAPKAFLDLIRVYQTTLFGLGEIALVFCVLYHAMNGLRILILDMWPALHRFNREAMWMQWALFLPMFFLPAFLMITGVKLG